MTTTVCETLGPTAIPDDGRLELIATLPAGELYSVALRWTHAFNGDLAFSLRAPGDSFATLFSNIGGASAGGDLTLRDGFPALTSADLVASAAGPFGRADENCAALTSAPHGSQYVEDESLEESEESSPGAPRTAAMRQAKTAERSIAEEFILSTLDYRIRS